MALGYFSNVEFVTDLQISFRFVRDMCHFARLAVEEMQKNKRENSDINTAKLSPMSQGDMSHPLASDRVDNFPLHVRLL